MDSTFDPKTLPEAIASLFESNNYTVERSVKIAGAEIDLVARPNGDLFAPRIWIEATVEYVNNTKYGKDLTKLSIIREEYPQDATLIVSSRGFTPDVTERAKRASQRLLTYAELFSSFERYDPYITNVLGDSELGKGLAELDRVYERPQFDDDHGNQDAVSWLNEWVTDPKQPNWLVITGEYGTGKTALSRILQLHWSRRYWADSKYAVPFRIELRDFTRQFDADGLLHYALDKSGLGHVPIQFFWRSIRSGRIVLVLDGYDEMAQYLTSSERRVCLQALAELSSGGAKGILFSRPNYFSEAEELRLLDTLYRDLEGRSALSAVVLDKLVQKEKQLDSILEAQHVERFERSIRDLNPTQTRALVARSLAGDEDAARKVQGILDRIFRSNDDGSLTSLSGKPVIISYILEVVDQLKLEADSVSTDTLTEWDVYSLVVDQLMIRDWRQVGQFSTEQRRSFLKTLAIHLSIKGESSIGEEDFLDLVGREFSRELNRYSKVERRTERDSIFQNLRRSATLTRSINADGWRFSHSSLREFLLAEALADALQDDAPFDYSVPVSDAMRQFASSLSVDRINQLIQLLDQRWTNRHTDRSCGIFLQLLWDAQLKVSKVSQKQDPSRTFATADPRRLAMDSISLSRLALRQAPHSWSSTNFSGSDLSTIDFRGADLQNSNFDDCILDGVDFSGATLGDASFRRSYIQECIFDGADLRGADFTSVKPEEISLIVTYNAADAGIPITGTEALGLLAFNGARTPKVPDYDVMRHHALFPIVEKIVGKFAEQSPRQRLGLEQKGASMRNIPFARAVVSRLLEADLVETRGGRADLLYSTPEGRVVFSSFVDQKRLPSELKDLLAASK